MNCYFCSSLVSPPGIVTLDASEARHAATSRRQRVGERVVLIDGEGGRATATIVTLERDTMELRIDTLEHLDRGRPAIVLAAAVPKGDRQNTLLDMAAQLGVAQYVPLICERSAVKPDARKASRWRRIFTQACKQSHNPYLPEIGGVCSPLELASSLEKSATPIIVAARDGACAPVDCGAGRVAVFVGPEGGFSTSETAALEASGARLMRLGQHVLRIETAAIAAVSVIQSRCMQPQ